MTHFSKFKSNKTYNYQKVLKVKLYILDRYKHNHLNVFITYVD